MDIFHCDLNKEVKKIIFNRENVHFYFEKTCSIEFTNYVDNDTSAKESTINSTRR